MTSSPSRVFAPFLVLAATTSFLVFATDLLPTFASLYSPYDEYRYQRVALLQGRFAIAYDPYGFPVDWAWANGLHQLWGLAVPIVQLPFEVLARGVGLDTLPDRLFLLGFHGVVTLVLYFALGRVLDQLLGTGDATARRGRLLVQVLLTLFCVLHPAFLTVVDIMFSIHPEAIAYSSLWGVLLLGLTLSAFATRSPRTYLVLCLLSGWSSLFRGPAVFYGVASLIVGTALMRTRLRWGRMVLALCLFSVGPSFQLYSNAVRFGHPLEFGYSYSIAGCAECDYALRRELPFHKELLPRRMAETLGALFLVKRFNGVGWLESDVVWFQVPGLRIREFYVPIYSSADLIATLVALGFLGFAWRARRGPPLLGVLGAWGGIAFMALWLFYARSPWISSRYTIDFLPALLALWLGLYLGMIPLSSVTERRPDTRGGKRRHAGARLGWAIAVLAPVLQWTVSNSGEPREWTGTTSASWVGPLPLLAESVEKPELPTAYRCENPRATFGIRANTAGWDNHVHCGAGPATIFFFPRTPCIDLAFNFDSEANRDVNLPALRVQLNGQDAVGSTLEHRGLRYTMRFCARGRRWAEHPTASRYSMAIITWNAAERFGWYSGALLHEVKVASP